MYWYDFVEDDISRAKRQAEAQAADSSKVGKSTRLVGNLGEIAFENFLERTLGPPNDGQPGWEYYNEPAMEAAKPEYNSTDFRVGWYDVDVKAAYDTRKFAPEAMYDSGDRKKEFENETAKWLMTHQEGHPKVDESTDSIYVFVSLSDNHASVEGGTGKVATILGWADLEDIRRQKNNYFVTTGGPRLSLRNFPELFTRAGFEYRS